MLLPIHKRTPIQRQFPIKRKPFTLKRILTLALKLLIVYYIIKLVFTSFYQPVFTTGPPFHLDFLNVRAVFWPYSLPTTFQIPHDKAWRHAIIPEIASIRPPKRSDQLCDKSGPRLLVGIFSTAERKSRRDLIRKYRASHIRGLDVEVKFVIGASTADLSREEKEHGDLLLLAQVENMNEGKSFAFLQAVATRVGPKPQFVVKADDDTLLHVGNLLQSLERMDCNDLVYFGTCGEGSCGVGRSYHLFFTGLAYGFSWPLVNLISTAGVHAESYQGLEDARIGAFVASVNTSQTREPVRYLNWKNFAGDLENRWIIKDRRTIALHGLKSDEKYKEQAEKLLRFRKQRWKKAWK